MQASFQLQAVLYSVSHVGVAIAIPDIHIAIQVHERLVGGLVHAIGNDILAHQRIAVHALEQCHVRREGIHAGNLDEVLSIYIIPISSLAHYVTYRGHVAVHVAVCYGKINIIITYAYAQSPPKVIADLVRHARLGVKHLGIHLVAHMEAVLYLLAILLGQEVATVVCTIL